MRLCSRGSELFRFFAAAFAVIILLLSSFTAQAVDYYWNPVGGGGSGNWNIADMTWSTDNINNNTPWVNGGNAILGTTAQTAPWVLTVDPAGVSVSGINDTYNNTSPATDQGGTAYQVSGGPITLVAGGDGNVDINTTGFLQVRSVMTSAGAVNLVKTGANYFDIFGANTYSGTTDIQGGGVDAQIATAFGTSSVTIENGAFMWWYGDGPGDGTSNGTVTYNNNFTFLGNGLGGETTGSAWNSAFTINGNGGGAGRSTAIFQGGSITLGGRMRASSNTSTLTINENVTLTINPATGGADNVIEAGYSGSGSGRPNKYNRQHRLRPLADGRESCDGLRGPERRQWRCQRQYRFRHRHIHKELFRNSAVDGNE